MRIDQTSHHVYTFFSRVVKGDTEHRLILGLHSVYVAKVRRLYDIANVFQSMNLLEKVTSTMKARH